MNRAVLSFCVGAIVGLLVYNATHPSPPGPWDYLTLAGAKDQPLEVVLAGDHSASGRDYNVFAVYDAAPKGGESIFLLEGFDPEDDSFDLCGGRVVVDELDPETGGRLMVVSIRDPIYRAFFITDRGQLDVRITVWSRLEIAGQDYRTKWPLVVASTHTELGGIPGAAALRVELNVANPATVALSDSYPVARSYAYREPFWHDRTLDHSDFSEWRLAVE